MKKIFFLYVLTPSFRFIFSAFLYAFFAISIFLFNTENLSAQSAQVHLVPRYVYVGDKASLILPLPSAAQNFEDIILVKNDSLSEKNSFPYDENIDFHRIILERRITGSRLIIEFTSFVPGLIKFPAIEIGGEIFSGLSVTVGSLINDRSDRILSGTAPALAMPGTALLLYGSMAVIAALIPLSIWFMLKGRDITRKLTEKWKRYRLFSGIRKKEKRLRKAVLRGDEKRMVLDTLSDEARIFLSSLTGKNCRAMTAREFKNLSVETHENFQNVNPYDFFRCCDEMRFSGADINSQDILRLLADLLQITETLEKSNKKEPGKTEEKAA